MIDVQPLSSGMKDKKHFFHLDFARLIFSIAGNY